MLRMNNNIPKKKRVNSVQHMFSPIVGLSIVVSTVIVTLKHIHMSTCVEPPTNVLLTVYFICSSHITVPVAIYFLAVIR